MMLLEPFFHPRGIAVIGASSDSHKLGYGVVRNLIDYGYHGPIYPVNPSASMILGLPCYATLEEVPDPVDLAVIIVPATAAVEMIEQCGRRCIGAVIVTSGGFGELGREGQQRERDLLAAAQRYGMRLVGPNCIGTIDTHTPLNTTFIVGMPQQGSIGFVSQSGAMCAVVIDWAQEVGIGFSRVVSLGNQIDVDITEMIAALASDVHTQVITAYIEGVHDGRAFLRTAAQVARHKPIVVLKGGYGESGARAVASHTGALAGSTEVYTTAFTSCGVLRATTTEELFDWARTFAWQPLPKGDRIAVLTNAGGPGILAVDAIDAAGLRLAPLTDATRAFLRTRLPPAAGLGNPIDVLAGSGPGAYALALDALLADPTVDAALVIQAPQDWCLPTSLAEVIGDLAALYRKPVLASLMGHDAAGQATTMLHQRHVPNFAFPERAASTLAAMVARQRWLAQPERIPECPSGIDHEAARVALEHNDFAAAVAAYGIAVAPTKLVDDVSSAVHQAEVLGYPVVMKVVSPQISHKSDVGGVAVGLNDAAAVRAAFDRIGTAVRAACPASDIAGMLVQPMFSGGHELIIGVRHDPQFGALVLVGSGGVEVELQRDSAWGIAPLDHTQAEQMLDRTRAGVRLRGWRGSPPGDRAALIEALVRLSWLAHDFPHIAELEANPLYVLPVGRGAWALDVRGVRR